jgi:hypothetical protein
MKWLNKIFKKKEKNSHWDNSYYKLQLDLQEHRNITMQEISDRNFERSAKQQGYEHYIKMKNSNGLTILIIYPYNRGMYDQYHEPTAKYEKGPGTHYKDLVQKAYKEYCDADPDFPKTPEDWKRKIYESQGLYLQ